MVTIPANINIVFYGATEWRIEAVHYSTVTCAPSETQAALLPGSICEVCLDALATGVTAAPWGGDMGICEACGLATQPTEEVP